MAVEAGSVPARLRLNDVTLRDGEQASRVAFADAEKVEIARLLEGLGIDQIQVGFAAAAGLVSAIRAAGVATPLELICVGFAPDWRDQIERAVGAGTDVVNLLFRTADGHLDQLGLERAVVLERLPEAVAWARECGAGVITFGPSFAMQADRGFVLEMVDAALGAGAERVTVADTLGSASPEGFAELIGEIAARGEVAVAAHCHDDLGLATACTLAALRAGAEWCDVSAAGFGERSGNAALEEVAVAATNLYGTEVGIELPRLRETVRAIAAVAGAEPHPTKPVVGADAFAQKLELHVRGVVERPDLFEPYPPSSVGGERLIRLGKGSGPTGVRAKAAEHGLGELSPEEVEEAVAWLWAEAERRKSYVEDADFVRHLRRRRGEPGDGFPSFAELPVREGAPPRSSWGVFGEREPMGTLNFIDAAAVRRAAGAVRGGRVFSLNAPVDEPAPPLFGREELRHEMIEKAGGKIVDDYLDRFHPQGASQWDALKHYADAAAGFYGGHDLATAMATGAGPIGIEHWARAGIVARGVLLDARRVLDFDPLAGYAIDAAALASLAERQGVELLPGDALIVRTGWLEAYLELGEGERAALAAAGDPPCPGLAGEDLAPFLWDNRIAAVATDNPALEAAYEGAAMGLELHRDLIARLGMPVGELWVLDDLAAACAEDGIYEFLLTSAPINLPGGAGSPANALAVR